MHSTVSRFSRECSSTFGSRVSGRRGDDLESRVSCLLKNTSEETSLLLAACVGTFSATLTRTEGGCGLTCTSTFLIGRENGFLRSQGALGTPAMLKVTRRVRTRKE